MPNENTTHDERDRIINDLQSDLQKFQRDIGNVAGSNDFFSVISQLRTLEIVKLKETRLDIFSKNINLLKGLVYMEAVQKEQILKILT